MALLALLLNAPLILSAFGPSKLPLIVRVVDVGPVAVQDALKLLEDGVNDKGVFVEAPVGIISACPAAWKTWKLVSDA